MIVSSGSVVLPITELITLPTSKDPSVLKIKSRENAMFVRENDSNVVAWTTLSGIFKSNLESLYIIDLLISKSNINWLYVVSELALLLSYTSRPMYCVTPL